MHLCFLQMIQYAFACYLSHLQLLTQMHCYQFGIACIGVRIRLPPSDCFSNAVATTMQHLSHMVHKQVGQLVSAAIVYQNQSANSKQRLKCCKTAATQGHKGRYDCIYSTASTCFRSRLKCLLSLPLGKTKGLCYYLSQTSASHPLCVCACLFGPFRRIASKF